ncbi:MAG: glycosyltransferase family 2 protein [Chloroflexi bacterium]|nr:glycosyltransferase family 2 protein [Chloroflexota bacterium]
MFDLGIVIVSWNVADLLKRCLASVFSQQSNFKFHVIVVDNASQDGSADLVQSDFPEVELIRSEKNLGYSTANNWGLKSLGFDGASLPRSRYVLLLNPDTELPPQALSEMVAYLTERPEVGAAGPKLILPDGSLDLACRRSFPSPSVSFWHFTRLAKWFPKSRRLGQYNMTYIDPDQDIEVDSVVGAFMLVRSEVIESVGLLDERFFMYGEDLDWAFRIKQEGWQIRYNPAVVVKHVKRASSSQSQRARQEFYVAMHLFYLKHYRKQTATWLHFLIMFGILLQGGIGLWLAPGWKKTKTILQSPNR